jgi:hypothetical protein
MHAPAASLRPGAPPASQRPGLREAWARRPPQLQRYARVGDLVHPARRATGRVGERHLARRAADLDQRPALQAAPALDQRKGAVACGHVGGSVEGDRAGEQVRRLRDQERRLLAAHRSADGVDLAAVDPDPGAGVGGDLGHSRQVSDLPRRSPGEVVGVVALALRVDHCEASERRQISPEADVRARGDATAMR